MSIPATYAVDFGLIIVLYGYKALLFRFVRSRVFLFGCFSFGVALTVPLTWLTSPDWNNEHVYRIAIWIGDPIAVLAIPCVSFLFDFLRGHRDMRNWLIRVPAEVFIAAPAWFFVWIMMEVFVLGWVWI
jgi:hypothetical protein